LLTFAITDGGNPNNVGRGYVVRRVLRRGARYARKYFEADIGDFFSKIVPTVVQEMGDMFPEIKKKEADVKEILNEEEESFARSLDRGEVMFEKYAKAAESQGIKQIHGNDVWRLYDTYGFPEDLTKIMAEERGLSINESEVREAQAKAKEASRGEKKDRDAMVTLDVHATSELEKEMKIPKTDDSAKFQKGNIQGQIKAIHYEKKFINSTKEVPEGEQLGLVLDKTNFYAEQGGQLNDTGSILIDGEAEIDVQNVQLYGGYVLHTGYMKYGTLSVGDTTTCVYDELRRNPIRNNHTGTHILNYALREVLGNDINQRGSEVAPEKLRFDFSHNSAPTDKQLEKVESLCTEYIRQNSEVFAENVDLKTARNIKGVRAVFGETYPDPVRVVSVGVDVKELLRNPDDDRWEKVSVEFCGGTHVEKTGDIKELVITENSGIAKGIRRIVAVTGAAAREVQREADDFSNRLSELERMQFSAEKEQHVKQIKLDLANLQVSTIKKSDLGKRQEKLTKDILNQQKEAQKQEIQKIMDIVKEHFSKNEDEKHVVVKLPFQSGSKAVAEVIKTVSTKDKEKTVYLIAAEPSGDKVTHGCHVAEVNYTLHQLLTFC